MEEEGEREQTQRDMMEGVLVKSKPVMVLEPLEKEAIQCESETSLYLLLIKRLRIQQSFRVGDPKLYRTLVDVAQFIQTLCKEREDIEGRRDALRVTGVLGALVDAWIGWFQVHLEDQTSPLTAKELLDCWTHLCNAMWTMVDNPPHRKNQEFVLNKILQKTDLKVLDFVLNSWNSIDRRIEHYVISILTMWKGLLSDNEANAEMLRSKDNFVNFLLESFRLRTLGTEFDVLMCKSIDLIAFLLSMILESDNGSTTEAYDEIAAKTELNLERRLPRIVSSCCKFLESSLESDKPPSVGTICLLARIFESSLNSVHQFKSCRGSDLLVKIQRTDNSDFVKDALRVLVGVFNVQSKRIRSNPSHDCHCKVCNYASDKEYCSPNRKYRKLEHNKRHAESVDKDEDDSLFDETISNAITRNQNQRLRIQKDAELSKTEVKTLLGDLQPYKVLETDDHLVVFCSSATGFSVNQHGSERLDLHSTSEPSNPTAFTRSNNAPRKRSYLQRFLDCLLQ